MARDTDISNLLFADHHQPPELHPNMQGQHSWLWLEGNFYIQLFTICDYIIILPIKM